MVEELTNLSERLGRAERSLRAVRRLALAAAVLLLGALMGVFTLMGRDHPRGEPAIQDVGPTVKTPFTVVDPQGHRVLEVAARGGGAHLILFTAGGTYPSVRLSYSAERGGELSIYDQTGSPVGRMASTGNGGRLEIFGPGERPGSAPGKKGTLVAALGNTEDGGRIELFDTAGKLVFHAP